MSRFHFVFREPLDEGNPPSHFSRSSSCLTMHVLENIPSGMPISDRSSSKDEEEVAGAWAEDVAFGTQR